jgi:Ca2+-binding RTX toxin-like protein
MAIKTGTAKNNTLNGTDGEDTLSGLGGSDHLYGLGGNDILNGGKGADYLDGGDGDDKLIGGAGNDMMAGSDKVGADEFIGGRGSDTVDYSNAMEQVTALLAGNSSAQGAAGDTYSGMENVIGSAFWDTLQAGRGGFAQGGLGNDVLAGGGDLMSHDNGGRLQGDGGLDTLNMNFGDTEAVLQRNSGYDTILGFEEGADMFFIDLSEFGLGDTFDIDEIRNSDNATAMGTHAQFIFEGDEGKLWFDSNGTEDGGRVMVAKFENSDIESMELNDFNYVL